MQQMRNYMIDIYRVLFTIMICLMHFETELFPSEKSIFEGGYLGVEYFFVLSGYLLCKAYESKKYENALDYTIAKVKRLMPYNTIMVFWGLVYGSYICLTELGMGMRELIKWGIQSTLYAVDEIFFLQMFFPSGWINFPTWYISVLIVVGFGYYLFLEKSSNDYGIYKMGIFVIAFVAFLYQSYGSLDVHVGATLIFKIAPGVLRGVAEIGVGILACKLDKCIVLSHTHACIIKALLILGLISIIVWYPHTNLDVVFVMLIMALITLEFKYPVRIKSMDNKHWRRTLWGWVSKITLGVYFCHFLLIQIFKSNYAYIQALTKDVKWLTTIVFFCFFIAAAYMLCLQASAFCKMGKWIGTRGRK